MSKLTQIENALRAIDPAVFHGLCDSYLYERGYERINAIGLVIGADKSKCGTPDTLIAKSDGTYILAEYSTERRSTAAKFERDLAKCLDPEITGIPLDRIREIVLCHNSSFRSEEEHRLGEICRSWGVIPSFFGLHTIAHDLYRKYPGLAKEFLGVAVDTGQILSTTAFVEVYGRGPLATPLDTTFRFREDERHLSDSLGSLVGASWWRSQDRLGSYEDSREYSFLWRRDDRLVVVSRLMEVFSAPMDDGLRLNPVAPVFLGLRGSGTAGCLKLSEMVLS